jgi:hypothetical protein
MCRLAMSSFNNAHPCVGEHRCGLASGEASDAIFVNISISLFVQEIVGIILPMPTIQCWFLHFNWLTPDLNHIMISVIDVL